MNLHKKESNWKKLNKCVTELSSLQKITWNAPLIKLDKPIQTGYCKKLKLRDDCNNRTDSNIYKQILEKIQVSVFCRKLNFLDRKGNPIVSGIKIIKTNEWNNLNWPEHYKKYFLFKIHSFHNEHGEVRCIEGYKFIQRFYFVDHIVPHYITHVRAKLPEVETRIKELKRFIDNNGGWDKYAHIKYGGVYKEKDYNQPRLDMIDDFVESQIKET